MVGVENDAGESLGAATPLDAVANIRRVRRKPDAPQVSVADVRDGPNLVERAYREYHGGRRLDMYLQRFGLRHAPLGKEITEPWDDGALAQLAKRFNWLLQSPGIGLITGEPGGWQDGGVAQSHPRAQPPSLSVDLSGRDRLRPRRHYRGLARALGIRARLPAGAVGRDIKERIHELADSKQVTPLWIIDEAQNLPPEFFRDFPAFLNFAFDSRDLISVWLVGHPSPAQSLERAPDAALCSRIQVRVQIKPVVERERFALLIEHALKSVGCQHTLLADSGMEVCARRRRGCRARRKISVRPETGRTQGVNHIPDELVDQAIEELRWESTSAFVPGRLARRGRVGAVFVPVCLGRCLRKPLPRAVASLSQGATKPV